MSQNTLIEWCDHTWNPWRGCTKVSEGCAHCYAETLSRRNPKVLGEWGPGRPRVLAKNWRDPVNWNRWQIEGGGIRRCPNCHRRGTTDCAACLTLWSVMKPSSPTVFPSLCDWLDDEVPVEWLVRFLELIHDTPNLTWLLLTKRPENWEPRLRLACAHLQSGEHFSNGDYTQETAWRFCDRWLPWNGVHRYAPPANVRIGVSVENQRCADLRIPELLKIPAAGRFLSLEPLLGRVDLNGYLPDSAADQDTTAYASSQNPAEGIQWLIIGGESGPSARPCDVDWIRSLRNQGARAGVAVFVKQMGAVVHAPNDQGWENVNGAEPTPQSWPTDDPDAVVHNPNGLREEYQGDPVRVLLNHPKGGEPTEWPEDLRVRQFPEGLR